jgi:hypothetical protein
MDDNVLGVGWNKMDCIKEITDECKWLQLMDCH